MYFSTKLKKNLLIVHFSHTKVYNLDMLKCTIL